MRARLAVECADMDMYLFDLILGIDSVVGCVMMSVIHSPQNRRDGHNNKSLRVYPPGESRPSQSGEEKWSATSYNPRCYG